MPHCKKLAKDLYEVRSTLENTIARVLFYKNGSEMILLHAFVKKTQKTPKGEFETALARQKEVLNV